MTTAKIADQTMEPGFIYSTDRKAARRQFRLSLGVVVGIGLAIGATILNIGVSVHGAHGYSADHRLVLMRAETTAVPRYRS